MVEQILHKFGFEKLDVWQSAMDLTEMIYSGTKQFPEIERYGLTSQLRRAVVSISSNIAEGSSKASLKDQARFSEIAFGSLMETLSQIILAYKLKYLSENEYIELRVKIEELSRQLNAFRNSQIKRRQDVF